MKLAATLPSTLSTTYARDARLLNSGFVRFWTLLGLSIALLVPSFFSNFWTGVLNEALIAIIGALALNLLMGTTGQISLGHAGFIAAGAFTAAALVTNFNAPLPLVLVAAALVGAILGVLVGLPALRLRGLYLAVSTLAAYFVITVSLGQYQAAVSYGSGFTLPAPSMLGFELRSEIRWYYVLLPLAVIVVLFSVNLLRSAYGRAWMAIRHRDIAAESLGIDAARYKLLAFATSTALTCVCGALWAYHTGFVSIEAFDVGMLIQYLAMVIIGGLGSNLGSVFGAIFVVVVPHLISYGAETSPLLRSIGDKIFEIQVGAFGVIMLLFLVFEPRGLVGIWARVRLYFELWPFKYRSWES